MSTWFDKLAEHGLLEAGYWHGAGLFLTMKITHTNSHILP